MQPLWSSSTYALPPYVITIRPPMSFDESIIDNGDAGRAGGRGVCRRDVTGSGHGQRPTDPSVYRGAASQVRFDGG